MVPRRVARDHLGPGFLFREGAWVFHGLPRDHLRSAFLFREGIRQFCELPGIISARLFCFASGAESQWVTGERRGIGNRKSRAAFKTCGMFGVWDGLTPHPGPLPVAPRGEGRGEGGDGPLRRFRFYVSSGAGGFSFDTLSGVISLTPPKLMRIGINTFLFTSPFTTESVKLFPTFKKWGFDTVEIPVESPEHIDAAKVKAAADKHGLAIGSLCACMGPGRDFRGTADEQKTAMTYCKAIIDQAAIMGCPRIIGPIYSVVGKADAVEPAQQKVEFALVVKNLKVLAAYAAKKGVELCIEPLNRFETDFLNTCDKGLQLLKAVGAKNVKLHLDTFHMNIEEKNQGDAIRKAGKHLGHFHACGSDRGTPGNDHIDWKSIAKALKDINYKHDVVIESFTTDVKVIARAAAIWRRIEPTRNEIATKGVQFLKKVL